MITFALTLRSKVWILIGMGTVMALMTASAFAQEQGGMQKPIDEDDIVDYTEGLDIVVEAEFIGSEDIPDDADLEDEIQTRDIKGFLIVKNVGNTPCLVSRGRMGYNLLGVSIPGTTVPFPLWTTKKQTILWAHKYRRNGAPYMVVEKRLTPAKTYFTYQWTINCR